MNDALLIIPALVVAGLAYLAVRQFLGTRGLVIGPWIKGFSRSKGYPMRPERMGNGWAVRFKPNRRLNAVLDYDFRIPRGATQLVFSYVAQIESVKPAEVPDGEPLVSLVLQRKGDNWTGKGKREFYRLYSPAFPLKSGPAKHTIPLTGWTGVYGREGDMADVIEHMSNIAVAFGHSAGRAHGVTGKGMFALTELRAI